MMNDVLQEQLGNGYTLSCRFTHVYPDGPAPYYSFSGAATPGAEAEQWQCCGNTLWWKCCQCDRCDELEDHWQYDDRADAQAAQATVADAIESESGSDELKAQAQVVHDLSQEFIASMVATGRTLVQIISEPTKPLSKFVTLHNIMETTEGPPNQPWLEVYEQVSTEIDGYIAEFDAALEAEMGRFEELQN